jgi:hypothetical protein
MLKRWTAVWPVSGRMSMSRLRLNGCLNFEGRMTNNCAMFDIIDLQLSQTVCKLMVERIGDLMNIHSQYLMHSVEISYSLCLLLKQWRPTPSQYL